MIEGQISDANDERGRRTDLCACWGLGAPFITCKLPCLVHLIVSGRRRQRPIHISLHDLEEMSHRACCGMKKAPSYFTSRCATAKGMPTGATRERTD
jgi:hypothetical protein